MYRQGITRRWNQASATYIVRFMINRVRMPANRSGVSNCLCAKLRRKPSPRSAQNNSTTKTPITESVIPTRAPLKITGSDAGSSNFKKVCHASAAKDLIISRCSAPTLRILTIVLISIGKKATRAPMKTLAGKPLPSHIKTKGARAKMGKDCEAIK